jgi:hypothetical protein
MAKLTEEQRQQRALARARKKALEAEEQDRLDRERREIWRREGMYLSWEECKAGEPCRGCGEPMVDGRGDWPGTMYLSEQERREFDAADQRFRERHPDCRRGRWGISGSRATHCMRCCPPPPWGPAQIEKMARLVSSWPSAEERKKDQDAWELTLTCDHIVRHTQHREHSRVSTAVVGCPECGGRRGVVQSVHVGPAYSDAALQTERAVADRERLTGELAAAQEKLRREERKAEATRRRIEEMRKQLEADS